MLWRECGIPVQLLQPYETSGNPGFNYIPRAVRKREPTYFNQLRVATYATTHSSFLGFTFGLVHDGLPGVGNLCASFIPNLKFRNCIASPYVRAVFLCCHPRSWKYVMFSKNVFRWVYWLNTKFCARWTVLRINCELFASDPLLSKPDGCLNMHNPP